MTELRKNLKWGFVFFSLIIICLLVLPAGKYFKKSAHTANIIQNGEVIRTVNLDITEPYEFEVISEDGGHNTIRVENGRIGIINADCPDKICVKQGFIDNGALPIVCLPHKLSVVITDNENDTDAVSGGI